MPVTTEKIEDKIVKTTITNPDGTLFAEVYETMYKGILWRSETLEEARCFREMQERFYEKD